MKWCSWWQTTLKSARKLSWIPESIRPLRVRFFIKVHCREITTVPPVNLLQTPCVSSSQKQARSGTPMSSWHIQNIVKHSREYHAHTHTPTPAHTHTHTHTHTRTPTHLHTLTHARWTHAGRTHILVLTVSMYIYVCMYMYVCMDGWMDRSIDRSIYLSIYLIISSIIRMCVWLVVSPPLKNMSSSVGMIVPFPILSEKYNIDLPNHQPDRHVCYMGLSIHGGTPKSWSILMGFSIKKPSSYWCTPILGNPP